MSGICGHDVLQCVTLLRVRFGSSFFCWPAAIEDVNCAVIDEYLANPQFFSSTEQLGPACIEILKTQPTADAVSGET